VTAAASSPRPLFSRFPSWSQPPSFSPGRLLGLHRIAAPIATSALGTRLRSDRRPSAPPVPAPGNRLLRFVRPVRLVASFQGRPASSASVTVARPWESAAPRNRPAPSLLLAFVPPVSTRLPAPRPAPARRLQAAPTKTRPGPASDHRNRPVQRRSGLLQAQSHRRCPVEGGIGRPPLCLGG
jgi:hypothetical protein